MIKSYLINLSYKYTYKEKEHPESIFIVGSPNFLQFFGVKFFKNTQNASKTEYFIYFDHNIYYFCTIS